MTKHIVTWLVCLAAAVVAPSLTRAANYFDNFDSYADGTLPAGWQYLLGPGRMSVIQGRFAQSTTTFNNYSYYAYIPQTFGNATYRMRLNVSDVAFNTMVIWRAAGQSALTLVFNTSINLPPVGHTRLLLDVDATRNILADAPSPFPGVHDLVIVDSGQHITVTMDAQTLFDVDVPTVLPAGELQLNPGDWGTGTWYDDLQVVDEAPTAVAQRSWGGLKVLYR